jgi:hypothetical protein
VSSETFERFSFSISLLPPYPIFPQEQTLAASAANFFAFFLATVFAMGGGSTNASKIFLNV